MRVHSPVPHKRARIEIIPLIDIMFFLLASFMMVSLSQTHMKGIRVNLPAAIAPPPSQVKDYVSLKVREGNVVTFDNQIVSDDQVLPRLYQLHQANPEIKVSISGDKDRIVTESVRAPRSIDNCSFDSSFKDADYFAFTCESQRATKSRATLVGFHFNARKLLQQFVHVLLICRPGASVTRRINPR